jgi:hypothetical protein
VLGLSRRVAARFLFCCLFATAHTCYGESSARVLVAARVLPNVRCQFGVTSATAARLSRFLNFSGSLTLTAGDVERFQCNGHPAMAYQTRSLASFSVSENPLLQTAAREAGALILTIMP